MSTRHQSADRQRPGGFVVHLFLPEVWGDGYAAEACRAALGWLDDALPGEPAVLRHPDRQEPSVGLALRLGFTEQERLEVYGAEQSFGVRSPFPST
ncbi:GNAT family N-acetyltransferase [Luteimicrobium sp. DT211]|uniref:GNAT family N-acetyltransferase n=1 Tax=Luteimicrobium sp. DT211 TaxID=3393412 RepID=UPI003CF2F436